jgi:hypothetical protein
MSTEPTAGGETTIVCSPGDKIAQARYWYRLVRTHRTEVTIRGFSETAAELTRAHGPEARILIKEARRIQREYDREQRKSLHLTIRSWHHAGKAFIYGFDERSNPIVRGYASRGATLVKCPWCGRAERHEGIGSDEEQVIVGCTTYPVADYAVRIIRLPLLIPAYIPTREAK